MGGKRLKETKLSGLATTEGLSFTMIRTINIGWPKIEKLCLKVIRRINNDKFNPEIVIAVQRGG